MTVHCWGERAEGTWTLEISDSPSQLRSNLEVLGKDYKDYSSILAFERLLRYVFLCVSLEMRDQISSFNQRYDRKCFPE